MTRELGYTCSGGVAVNKLLAKLGCGLHKPNKQTLVFPEATACLLHGLAIDRLQVKNVCIMVVICLSLSSLPSPSLILLIRLSLNAQGLGGMFGDQVKSTLIQRCRSYLGEEFTGDSVTCGMVLTIPQDKLESLFGCERGSYLHRMCNGTQDEKVQSRSETKTLSSGKTFFKHRTLTTLTDVDHWLGEFACELFERMCDHRADYNQAPTSLTVSAKIEKDTSSVHVSKVGKIDIGRGGSVSKIADLARSCFRRIPDVTSGGFVIVTMGMALSHFIGLESNSNGLAKWMQKSVTSTSTHHMSTSTSTSTSSTSTSSPHMSTSKSSQSSSSKGTITSVFNPTQHKESKVEPKESKVEQVVYEIDQESDPESGHDESELHVKGAEVDAELLSEMVAAGVQTSIAESALLHCCNDINRAFEHVFLTSTPTHSHLVNDLLLAAGESPHSPISRKTTSGHSSTFPSSSSSVSVPSSSIPSSSSSSSSYTGVEAHEVDVSVLKDLPVEVANEVRRQMLLESKSKKRPKQGIFNSKQSKSKT